VLNPVALSEADEQLFLHACNDNTAKYHPEYCEMVHYTVRL